MDADVRSARPSQLDPIRAYDPDVADAENRLAERPRRRERPRLADWIQRNQNRSGFSGPQQSQRIFAAFREDELDRAVRSQRLIRLPDLNQLLHVIQK